MSSLLSLAREGFNAPSSRVQLQNNGIERSNVDFGGDTGLGSHLDLMAA